jgi:4-hydroxybenzoate polyprenyltransferase
MEKLFSRARRAIASIENTPTSLWRWSVAFLAIIITRVMIENFLNAFETRSFSFLFYEFSHTFLFFLFSFLLLLPVVARFGQASIRQASNVSLFGFLVILTPPVLDVWIAHGKLLWSFYAFDDLSGLWIRYLTLFGDHPDIGITYGVRIEVVLTTLFFAAYTIIKTRAIWRAILAAWVTYTLLFFLGTLPSWLSFLFLAAEKSPLKINAVDIAGFFLSPPTLFYRMHHDIESALNVKMSLLLIPCVVALVLWLFRRNAPEKFRSLLGNIRLPQTVFHAGLILSGVGLAVLFAETLPIITLWNALALIDLLIAVECAWLASVIVNDLFDRSVDALSNPHRPLQQNSFSIDEYTAMGRIFFFASLLGAAVVSFKIALLLVAWQALAWLYSAPPLRLKRVPLLASFLSAITGILMLSGGFLVIAPEEHIRDLPLSFLWLLLFALSISLPIKDFKDMAGDRNDGVYTLPVLLGETWGKILIGSGVFLSYVASVVVLREIRLAPWAILCGSLSFWIITHSRGDTAQRFSYRKLPGWIMLPVALYAIVFFTTLS